MQTLSSALTAALLDIDARVTPRVLIDLYEFYSSDAVPGIDGFDPDDAIESFAAEEITWNGNAYRRELISRGDIVRNFGEKTNTTTLTFSNISRYMATLAQSQQIEGLFLVIRCVAPSVTDDSVVLFVGRCDKPSDIDKKTFSLTARQDFGNINQEIPPRIFAAEDPNGRVPNDPLYEGFRITALQGSFGAPVTKPSTSFFGRLFGKTKKSIEQRQWSSLDNTPYGSVVPMEFGRCQMELIPIFFADIGYADIAVYVVGEGRVDSFTDVAIRDDRFVLATVEYHYGDPGGTGTNNTNTSGPISQGYLSRTAYVVLSWTGSSPDEVDEAPLVTALVRGVQVPLPDSSGDFTDEGWSDNPAYIARFILTDPRLVNIDPAFMEDPVNYLTGLHCEEPLIDDSNSEVTLIPTADGPQTGTGIIRHPSTGIINTRLIRFYKLGLDPDIIPEEQEADYTTYDIGDIPTNFTPVELLRKRYTYNGPLTDATRAVDFLYKSVFPAFKGYLRINKRGKYEIRSEQSSDATMLRSATAIGDTAVPVYDVTPWKSGPELLTGRILLGFGLTASEVRDVDSADYSTAGNSVTLTAGATGGGVTATASGANLSGGSTSVQASGTVTIGGTPAAGNTATVTINGIASVQSVNADDTTGTIAALLAARINANPKLKRYITAEWDSGTPTVVTIKAKHGVLNLDSALLKAHSGPIADPTVSPSLSSSAGTLEAGVYKVAYADVTAMGQTALSPIASITLGASEQIDVGALALVGTSRNWYASDSPGSAYLKYVGNTNGSAFSITQLPLPGAAIPKGYNTTGEELLRIAMSFATNSQDIYPVWKPLIHVLVGETYLPTVPNGHKYEVSVEGDTGAVEPTWTTGGTGVPFVTSNPSGSLRSDFTGCLGFWFTTPASPVVTVTDLGRWKVAGNNQSHTVYLKLADNTVIASAVIDFSAGGTNGAYNYTPITPVALTPSTIYYLVSSETNGGDQWYDDQAHTNTGTVSAGNSVYQPSCAGAFTNSGPFGNSYVAPNIKFLGSSSIVSGTAEFEEAGSTVLAQAGLTRANVKKDTFKWPLGSRQPSINQIKGKYRDSNNDFALTPFTINDRIHQLQVKKKYPMEVDLSAVDNAHQKDRIGNFLLAKHREGDWFNALETGPQGMVLEEGDVICASDDSGGLVNVVTRIEEIRIHANHDVSIAQARKYSTLMFADEVGQDIIPVPTTLRYTQTVDSLIEFIDNFPIRDADGLTPGFYIAVSRDLNDTGDWRGWELYADYGDGYVKIAEGDIPAIVGVADTTLASVSNATVFDDVNTFDFTLKFGPPAPFANPFATVTKTELSASSRRNLFLLGNEYIQAATITSLGGQSYRASNLLRGRFGTDRSQLTHVADERIVFLNGAEQFVAIDPVRLNSEYNYKAVTTNQDVADAAAVPFTWTGGTVKAVSPGNVTGDRDSDGDLLSEWSDRSRFASGMTPGSDVPIGEEKLLFNFKVMLDPASGEDVVRAWPVITGQAMAAVLNSDSTSSKFDWVQHNTLSGAAYPAIHQAASIQTIQQPGNFVQGTLVASAVTDVPECVLGLIPAGIEWRQQYAKLHDTPSPIYDTSYLVSLTYYAGLQIYDHGSLVYTDAGITTEARVHILLSGSEIRFYLNYVGPGSLPFYVSPIAPTFPYRMFASVRGSCSVESVIMTTNPNPKTVYSTDQQTEDFGSPQDPIRVRVSKVSAITGEGEFTETII